MTLKLDLTPDLELRLRLQAERMGKSEEDIVLDVLRNGLSMNTSPELQANTRKKKLQEIIDMLPKVSHYVDDSRESIYEGRGE